VLLPAAQHKHRRRIASCLAPGAAEHGVRGGIEVRGKRRQQKEVRPAAAALPRVLLPPLAAAAALALAATAFARRTLSLLLPSEGATLLPPCVGSRPRCWKPTALFRRILLQDSGQVVWQRRLPELTQASEARLGSEGPPLPGRGRCGVGAQHERSHWAATRAPRVCKTGPI